MGAHIIDVNNWVFDSEPVSVFSLQGINDLALRKRDSMDHAGVLVRYANNALMNYGGNVYNYGASAADTFFGQNGSVQIGKGEITINYGIPKGMGIQGEAPKPETIKIPGGDGVSRRIKTFRQSYWLVRKKLILMDTSDANQFKYWKVLYALQKKEGK